MSDDPTAGITYEAARAELREIVAALEAGGAPLEDSLALWERGEVLADVCRRWLDDAGQRLDAAIAAHDADDAGGGGDGDGDGEQPDS